MTREKAIEVFTELNYAYKADEYGDYFYDHGDEVCQAASVAIAALREKEERSKGCSACDGGFGDNTMVFYAGGYKHCPMCGRRLEEV